MTFSLRLRHAFPAASLDIAFDLPSPGVIALFGPSGAGKSTVLAAAAGLFLPDLCRMALDGFVLADTEAGAWPPPERRRAGLVFQDAKLFPHMSVANNLRYGQRRAPPGGIRFDDVIDLLGIAALLPRRPHTLSGGERQRVAIGRALLAQPRLLLLDEPLSNLDSGRKAEVLPYFARVQSALRLPVLFVTHAFEEVAMLADSLVLLERGRVVAAGALADVAARADLPLAARDDAGALLACRVIGHDRARGLTRLAAGGAELLVPLADLAENAEVRVRVAAREVILAKPSLAPLRDDISLHNVLPGTVRAVVADSPRAAMMVEIDIGGPILLARVTPDAVRKLALAPGATVLALVKSTSVDLLRRPLN